MVLQHSDVIVAVLNCVAGVQDGWCFSYASSTYIRGTFGPLIESSSFSFRSMDHEGMRVKNSKASCLLRVYFTPWCLVKCSRVS